MLRNFTFIVALRYFTARKKEKFVSIISGISLAGITIGVAALIVVMAVMNGFHIELTRNIIGLNGDIVIRPKEATIGDYQEVISSVESQVSVKKVTPVITGQALVIGSGANSGALVKGINLADLKGKGEILGNVLEGSFSDYEGNGAVAVGSALARNLGVTAGSKIRLISPNLIPTAFGSMPRSKEFHIVAVFSSGHYEYDATTILMPLTAARKFFAMGEGINLIEINLENPDLAGKVSGILRYKFGSDLKVINWLEDHAAFLAALALERTVMFAILSLIIMVAAFNIISSLFMTVKDKTRDIAILKTMGASVFQIMNVFIISGFLVGVIGTCLGVSLGLAVAYNLESIRGFLERFSGTTIFDPAIYFLYNLPSVVRVLDVVMVASLSLLLSLLATIYPSFKAAKLNPVEAMRYE